MRFKFMNKKVLYDGHKFDSEAECERYKELVVMQSKGLISGLELQKSFEIIPKLLRREVVHLKTKDKVVWRTEEQRAIYTCDFFYLRGDTFVIEEYKSPMTARLADYVLRKKLIKQLMAKWNEEGKKYEFKEVISSKKSKTKRKKTNGTKEEHAGD